MGSTLAEMALEMEVRARIADLKRQEIEAGDLRLWYLSFADGAFRGAVIVRAFGITDAVEQAHQRGINPGGAVAAMPVPAACTVPEGAQNRLLSEDDLRMYFGETTTVKG
jgi:hypothetical protein